MKTEKYLCSILLTLLSLLFASITSASYIKYTYQTPIMDVIKDQSYFEDGIPVGLDLFWEKQIQLDVAFIIPELNFNLDEGKVLYKQFGNPVTSVSASDFFHSITINHSRFIIEAYKIDGEIFQDWRLTFDITDSNFPNNMERRSSVELSGSTDYMKFYQDDYLYQKPYWNGSGYSWDKYLIDTEVEFQGEYAGEILDEYPGGIYRLFGSRIPVPEPTSPLLLLAGLGGMFFIRRCKQKPNLHVDHQP